MDTHPDYFFKLEPGSLFIHLLGQNFIDLYLPHIPGKKHDQAVNAMKIMGIET